MKIISILVIVVGVTFSVLNLYLSHLQNILFVKGIYKFDKRFSLKRLDQSIEACNEGLELEKLIRCRKNYLFYLFLFYIELALIVLVIISAAIQAN